MDGGEGEWMEGRVNGWRERDANSEGYLLADCILCVLYL